jgi:hypothetical protein
MFSRSSRSYYVGDTAFVLLNRIFASKLIVSHFRRFVLTSHTVKRKSETLKKTNHSLFQRGLDRRSSAADMEDIKIDILSFASSSKYLGSSSYPELNDTADITLDSQPDEKAIRLMNGTRQQKMHRSISRRRLYQAIVVNVALWGECMEKDCCVEGHVAGRRLFLWDR